MPGFTILFLVYSALDLVKSIPIQNLSPVSHVVHETSIEKTSPLAAGLQLQHHSKVSIDDDEDVFPWVSTLPPLDAVWQQEVNNDQGNNIWGNQPLDKGLDFKHHRTDDLGDIPLSTLIPLPKPYGFRNQKYEQGKKSELAVFAQRDTGKTHDYPLPSVLPNKHEVLISAQPFPVLGDPKQPHPSQKFKGVEKLHPSPVFEKQIHPSASPSTENLKHFRFSPAKSDHETEKRREENLISKEQSSAKSNEFLIWGWEPC